MSFLEKHAQPQADARAHPSCQGIFRQNHHTVWYQDENWKFFFPNCSCVKLSYKHCGCSGAPLRSSVAQGEAGSHPAADLTVGVVFGERDATTR